MARFFKKEKLFLIIFSISVIIFLWDLFFLKKTFIVGDYKQQFFPWSMEYAAAIKHFTLPFWTPYMGCGFPLVAEGQIGPFYPLNIILFFILPPITAYSYSIILHFILGGIFMYIFVKKIGLNDIAAIMPSILFMFASPYAGCFSNIASLKALCWFPLVLYMIYVSFEKGKPYILCFSGIVMGIQLLAGAPQVAFYSIFFSAAYFLFMLICARKTHKANYAAAFIAGGFIALAVSSPQTIVTNTLVSLSNRSQRDLSFALSKSFFPAGILTLIFPNMAGIFEGMFYIGIMPLIFAVIAVFNKNKNKQLLFFAGLFLFSFLCAIGRYNPVYSFFLKITKFYIFRIQSKFLFFSAFSLIVLSGFGLQSILGKSEEKDRRKANIISLAILAISAASVVLTGIFLRIWKDGIIFFAKEYISKHFYNSNLHKYPIQYYFNKIDDLHQSALNLFSLSNKYTCIQFIILLASAALVILYNRTSARRELYKKFFICFIFTDLLFFGVVGMGLRGNIADISKVTKEPDEIKILKKDNTLFRIFLFKPYESQGALQSNLNMYFGADNVGIYSPLVFKRYYDLFNELGCIDDSTGVIMPSKEKLSKNLTLLNIVNVKYIISGEEIKDGRLELINNVNGESKIYLNKTALSRAFIVHRIKIIRGDRDIIDLLKSNKFSPMETAIIEEELPCTPEVLSNSAAIDEATIAEYTDRRVSIKTRSGSDGLLIVSDYFYPGWKGYLDGKPVKVLRADYILRAVYLPKGEHEVRFVYQ